MIEEVTLGQLSVANLTVFGGSPLTLIQAAAESGFGAVGLLLRSATPNPLSHEIVGKPEVVREIRAACGSTGVRVFDVEAFLLKANADVNAYHAALDIGAQLGATHISVVGSEWQVTETFLTDAERIDLFGRLCEAAAQFGLHVGVEFMLYRDVSTLQDALKLIDASGAANAGVILDVLHFHRTGVSLDEIAAIPRNRLAYVQLCDAVSTSPLVPNLAAEARGGRLYLGDGVIPIDRILNMLPSDVQLVMETPVAADAHLSAAEKVAHTAKTTKDFFAARSVAR